MAAPVILIGTSGGAGNFNRDKRAAALAGAPGRAGRKAQKSSSRLWTYGGENFYAPLASKICLPRKSTTISKGGIQGFSKKNDY